MTTLHAIKWLNTKAASTAAAILLFCFLIGVHQMATLRINMTEPAMPTETQHEVRVELVRYFQFHPGVAVVYVFGFIVCLWLFQTRQPSKWMLRSVFLLLAMPGLVYAWICLRVSTQPLNLASGL